MNTSLEKVFAEIGRLHVQIITMQEQLQEVLQKNQALALELEALKAPKAENTEAAAA